MKKHLALISCSKTKLEHVFKAQAVDMYRGYLFKKSVMYVNTLNMPYMILSAKYGVVEPWDRIENYDHSLVDASKNYRHQWAKWVGTSLTRRFPNDFPRDVTLLAGEKYTHPELMTYLKRRCARVHQPLQGLRLGEQLQWLNRQLTQGL